MLITTDKPTKIIIMPPFFHTSSVPAPMLDKILTIYSGSLRSQKTSATVSPNTPTMPSQSYHLKYFNILDINNSLKNYYVLYYYTSIIVNYNKNQYKWKLLRNSKKYCKILLWITQKKNKFMQTTEIA